MIFQKIYAFIQHYYYKSRGFLKSDYAFKELFSHENVRKQFLSDVLNIPLERIKSAILQTARIYSKNDGLREAIEILKEMGLSKSLRYKYEMNLKLKRDRKAEDDYVKDCGKAEGKAEDILQLLGELGPVPTELADKIMSEKDLDVMRGWPRAAAKAESVQGFRKDCKV